MEWTRDQSQALYDVQEWLNIFNRTDEDRFYCLFGPAGTGKTTIILEILKLLGNKSVVVSAPTHKAKEVVSKMTGKVGETIHALLGLKPDLDLEHFNPSNPQYKTLGKEKIYDYTVILVDECSMVNKALDKTLKDKIVTGKKLLIYVGDARQLPPVGEKLSNSFKVKHTSELREIVRQEGSNPCQTIILEAMNDVEDKTATLPTRVRKEQSEVNFNNDEGKEQGFHIMKDKEKFYAKLIELYSDSEAKTNMEFIKTLAYTNAAVEKLNIFIKNRINPSPEYISQGDFLLGYKTCVDESGSIVVQNSADYYIYSIDIIFKKILLKEYKFYRVTVNTAGKTIEILHPDSYDQFSVAAVNLYNNAIARRAWRPFYAFKEKFVVLNSFYHPNLLDKYHKPQLIFKKDIDLGYAMTVHKSQGSTYENVAIMYSNFNVCRDDADRRSLIYVAFSRTKYLNLVY